MTRRLPLALVALFAVVGTIAALAYAINAWQVFGFASHVWHLPFVLCMGAAVVADALSLSGLFATYLLRNAPRRVRAYAWSVFLGMTGLSIAAAESFASWRRLPVAQQADGEAFSAQVAAGAIVVALAFATHLLIVANRHVVIDESVDVKTAEAVAGVPVEVDRATRQPGVYRALGKNPVPPLYIGSTRDLASRIASHKTSSWIGDVVRWTFEPYGTIDAAEIAERALVEAENPIHNKRLRVGAPNFTRSIPRGANVETLPPSIDVSKIVPPVRRTRMPSRAPKKNPGDIGQREAWADRVIAGERTVDVAKDAGVSKRSVEMWVRARRQQMADRTESSAETYEAEPQVNGYPILRSVGSGPSEVASD